MATKARIILFIIIVVMIAMIVGCVSWNSNSKRMIENNKETLNASQRVIKNTIETETDKEVDANQVIKPVSLGNFKLTAYCSCSLCCGKWALSRPIDNNGNEIVYGSIGERLKEEYSIAVDPSVIAYRTEVIINGKVYKAQDCGGAIKGNRIDIYFEDHQEALNFGIQYSEVFLVEK